VASLSLCGYLNNVDVRKHLWRAEPRDKSLCHLCFYIIYSLLVDLSLYLAYILRFRFDLLWCACAVCRDFIDTLGYPCGSPTLSLVCARTRRGDLHIAGSVCVKPVWLVSVLTVGWNFYKCAYSHIHPPLGNIKILSRPRLRWPPRPLTEGGRNAGSGEGNREDKDSRFGKGKQKLTWCGGIHELRRRIWKLLEQIVI
jgi:hypothetical protein